MVRQLTEKQINQNIIGTGWMLTFDAVIVFILNNLMIALFGNARGTSLFSIILCMIDRAFLKTYKDINISIWRCLLTPVYLYKRCQELHEPMTKFYINLVLWIVSIIIQILFLALLILEA